MNSKPEPMDPDRLAELRAYLDGWQGVPTDLVRELLADRDCQEFRVAGAERDRDSAAAALAEQRAEVARLEGLLADRQDAEHELAVIIYGNPGLLGINNAKKAVVIKGQARLVEVGTVRKSKAEAEAAVWASALGQTAAVAAISQAGKVSVDIDSYWPRRRALPRAEDLALGDVDAPLKLTQDALQKAGVLDDDCRVVEIHARKFIDKQNPRIEMRVRPA